MSHTSPTTSLTLLFVAAFFVICLGGITVRTQTAIIGLPSTDVMSKGKVGLRFVAKFKPYSEDARKQFSSFVPRFYVGVGKNVEVGVNLIGNVQPGLDTPTLVPIVKWRFYQNEKYKLAAVVGNHFYIPLNNRKYKFGTYTYVQMSKVFKSGTRITAGSYLFTKNVVAANADRGGAQLGLEQTINKRVTFAAEWMSGRHSSGNLSSGFRVKIDKHFSAILAYTVMNNKAMSGNHYFLAVMGFNF